MSRYFIELSYKGTNYHGWQIQKNAHTVQAEIEKALSTLLQQNISVVGAGRTDAGVHAKNMVAHFDCDNKIENINHFIDKINGFLPFDISILDIRNVKNDAHARFDALSRSYEYFISLKKNPFYYELATYTHFELDVSLMNEASAMLLKNDDFASFCKLHSDNKTTFCKVSYAKWEMRDDLLVFKITSDRFLRDMVRAIVGSLINVGRVKCSLKEFETIIEAKKRSKAGMSAPANGLFLVDIKYPENIYL